MLNCRYCDKELKNSNSLKNHECRCPKNLNRNYVNGMTGKKGSNHYIKCKELGLPKPQYDTSNRKRSGVALWSSEKKSEVAKALGLGGYRENAGISKKYKVFDSFGNATTLQSSYELKCSEILNELNITWIRPKCLRYNNNKRYFPDFYLVDYDIYLDPKNDYKAKQDEIKIKCVVEQNNVKLFVLKKIHISKEYIQCLCS